MAEGETNELEVRTAARTAGAACVCWLIAEWLHLEYAYLAVITTHIVSSRFIGSSFQKSVERVVGRGIGILYGLFVHYAFHDVLFLGLVFKLLGMWALFYVHFTGRLAYTFLQAGFYLAVVVEAGYRGDVSVSHLAAELFAAVVLGAAVAEAANWLLGGEEAIVFEPGGGPILPPRFECANRATMLVVTVLVTQTATGWLDLPTSAALVSVLFLTTTTDHNAMVTKGVQRLEGALAGLVYGIPALLLLVREPRVPILAALLFLGILIGSYLAWASQRHSYVGLQMGLVVPMLLLVPRGELGELTSVWQRIEGIVAALLASIVVGGLWPGFPRETPLVSTTSPAMTGPGDTRG